MSKDPSLEGTAWSLLRYGDAELPENVVVTLMYDPEQARIAGRSGCNRYFGPVTVRDGRIEVGNLASTRRMCPPPMMEVEGAFLKMMQSAGAYHIEKGQLIVECAEGQQLVFAPTAE